MNLLKRVWLVVGLSIFGPSFSTNASCITFSIQGVAPNSWPGMIALRPAKRGYDMGGHLATIRYPQPISQPGSCASTTGFPCGVCR